MPAINSGYGSYLQNAPFSLFVLKANKSQVPVDAVESFCFFGAFALYTFSLMERADKRFDLFFDPRSRARYLILEHASTCQP
jgi:hypothetical protein